MFKKLIGLIVLILLVFSGFYVYRMHENVKDVMSYEAEVEKSLKAQGLSGDTKLALAIIYTETKGKQVDIMQSSESVISVCFNSSLLLSQQNKKVLNKVFLICQKF